MKKHSTDKLKVAGKMSSKGADRAGLIQSLAPLILALGLSVAAILFAL
jgi:hypothetical protein